MNLTQIYYKQNELFQTEFYKDKKCTQIVTDCSEYKNIYLELKDGNITSFVCLYLKNFRLLNAKYFIPFIPNRNLLNDIHGVTHKLYSLDDITPNLSKYIPEDNAILFLSDGDKEKYEKSVLTRENSSYTVATFGNFILYRYDKEFPKNYKKATIFISNITQETIQKANEVAKELKEKYGVEEVNLFGLYCFCDFGLFGENEYSINNALHKHYFDANNFNKIITTNSTGILEPQNTERLQVIDCKEIFDVSLTIINKHNK